MRLFSFLRTLYWWLLLFFRAILAVKFLQVLWTSLKLSSAFYLCVHQIYTWKLMFYRFLFWFIPRSERNPENHISETRCPQHIRWKQHLLFVWKEYDYIHIQVSSLLCNYLIFQHEDNFMFSILFLFRKSYYLRSFIKVRVVVDLNSIWSFSFRSS